MDSFQKAISKFPLELIQQMKDTKQNPVWHPEGNLYNHIWMVYDGILKDVDKLHDDNYWDTTIRDFLICALFHDLGKIQTTRLKTIKDGSQKLVSYGHEEYAKEYLDKYLFLFNFCYNYSDKEMIYEVCANHMRTHLFDKMKESKKIEFCKNPYCLQTLLFSKYDDMSKGGYPTFVMTIGIPGSGKSSWIKSLEIGTFTLLFKDYEVVCPDLIRKEVTGQISDISQDKKVWEIAKERVVNYLKEGKTCVLDSTMCKSSSRKKFIEGLPLCFRYAKVFEVDPLEAHRRIRHDMKNEIDRSNVPESVVFKMFADLEQSKKDIHFDGFEIL